MKRDYIIENERDSFVLYKSQFEPISELTNEQLGRFFRCIFQWQIEGVADPEPDILIPFKFYANQFRIDDNKYDEKCRQNKANGKLGGRPTKTERLKKNRTVSKKPNGGHNDNDNENENENENVNVSSSRKSGGKSLTLPYPDNIEFVNTWNELRQQPKWRKKTVTALQKSLNQLGPYPVEFVIELMNDAIAGGYQGVVFADTPERFRKWQQSHQNKQPGKTAPDYGGCLVV